MPHKSPQNIRLAAPIVAGAKRRLRSARPQLVLDPTDHVQRVNVQRVNIQRVKVQRAKFNGSNHPNSMNIDAPGLEIHFPGGWDRFFCSPGTTTGIENLCFTPFGPWAL